MAVIIPAAVLVAPAVCHMMRAKQEEEERQASKKKSPDSVTKPDQNAGDEED